MQKSINSLALYEKQIQAMGFESMLLFPPPPPPSTASAAKKISGITKNLRCCEVLEVTRRQDHAMDVDDEYDVEEFVAEVEKVDDDPNTDEDAKYVFCGFHRTAGTTGTSDEKSGSLYRMDALTSEADALMSFPFKPSVNSASSDKDVDETLIMKKIAERKGKVKEATWVEVKGKQGARGNITAELDQKDKKERQGKKTRGVLL